MINTYQSSQHHHHLPPPVPPRLGRSGGPVLITTAAASGGHGRPLLRFLAGVVLAQLLLSVGGFTYLYLNQKQDKTPSADGKVAFHSSAHQHSAMTMASMVVKFPDQSPDKNPEAGILQWDMGHSVLRNVDYYHGRWLTVLQAGDYYVYSRVTFSGWDPKQPLTCRVLLKEGGSDKAIMTSYCSREQGSVGPCTVTQGQLVALAQGSQLSVWVQNLSVVNYGEEATSFGLFKL